MKKAERQAIISNLATKIIQRASANGNGSVCLVPSASEAGKSYRVEIDADYCPVSCNCQGGRGNCKHKQAAILFFAPSLPRLLDSSINPVYGFQRAGRQVEARLSQFSRAEKAALEAALLEQQRLQNIAEKRQARAERDARRALYNSLFDPNGVDSAMYA